MAPWGKHFAMRKNKCKNTYGADKFNKKYPHAITQYPGFPGKVKMVSGIEAEFSAVIIPTLYYTLPYTG
jgi:hypothetical protein